MDNEYMESCADCRYSRVVNDDLISITLECRYKPPELKGWPMVQPTDWCSQCAVV